MPLKKLVFYKMHGTGNDFLIIDGREDGVDKLFDDVSSGVSTLASQLGNRKTGIGFDQLLLIKRPTKPVHAKVYMKIFNNDGSPAGMCGNGIRCTAYFVRHLAKSLLSEEEFGIETDSKIVKVRLLDAPHDAYVETCTSVITQEVNVKADMGPPEILEQSLDITLPNMVSLNGYSISMGNPHYVTFLGNQSLSTYPVHEYGPLIEHMTNFPYRTNVEFVEANMNDTSAVKMRVWERGAGETLSCGSGACAVGAAALLRFRREIPQLNQTEVLVHLPGGDIKIEWNPEELESSLFQSGPASFVGQIELTVWTPQ